MEWKSDAAQFVEQHPEIKSARLVYLWPFLADVEGEDGTVREYSGYRLDEEYTFIGRREELMPYLDDYGIWDAHIREWEDGIKDGVLDFEYVDYNHEEECIDYIPDDAFFVIECKPDDSVEIVIDRKPEEFCIYHKGSD